MGRNIYLPKGSFPDLIGLDAKNTTEEMWSRTSECSLASCYDAAISNRYDGMKKGALISGIAVGSLFVAGITIYLVKKYNRNKE